MMQSLYGKIKTLNDETRGLLSKCLVVACVLGLVFLIGKLLPYIAPFVLALLLSVIMGPLVNPLAKLLSKVRLPRAVATLIGMVVVFGLLLLILTVVTSFVFVEAKSLAASLPRLASELVVWLNGAIDEGLLWVNERWDVGAEIMVFVRETINDLGRTLTSSATAVANFVARRAFSTAISVPQIILFIMLTIMGTFYLSSDRDRILRYLKSLLPPRGQALVGEMKRGLFRALFGQLRSEMILTLVLFVELLIGFSILRVNYAVLLALVVAILGPLPVVGPGMVLLPWCLYGFLTGNTFIGVGMLVIFLVSNVVRELLSPRVLSAQLGVYPLSTMISMYAGFVVYGFLGLLLGPTIYMMCRVAVLALGTEDPPVKPPVSGVEIVKGRARQTVSRLQLARQRRKQAKGREEQRREEE